MTVEEWLGEENQLGTDIWTKKYCNGGEDFEQWLNRISGGNKAIAEYIRQKKFLFGGRILSNRGLNEQGRKVTYSNCSIPRRIISRVFLTVQRNWRVRTVTAAAAALTFQS